MNNILGSFWNARVEDLVNGFRYDEKTREYECLLCGARFGDGIVYCDGGVYYEARRFVKIHIEKEHGSVFEFLLRMDKKFNGLTDHQRKVLSLFREGLPDSEISKRLGGISVSTVRNHRFVLREYERQSRIFLALMTLSNLAGRELPTGDQVAGARPEAKKSFPFPIAKVPKKHRDRTALYESVAGLFDPRKKYREKEVNEILKGVHHDHAWLRRALIDYKFMERKSDGSLYWLRPAEGTEPERPGEEKLDKRKELKAACKETKTVAGVYCFRNTANGRVLVGSSLNLKSAQNRLAFELETGKSFNDVHAEMIADCRKHGKDKFEFEILETIKEDDIDPRKTLEKLEKKWIEKLGAKGENGYNA